MKPSAAVMGKDMVPIYVSGFQLRDGSVPAVGTSNSGPQPKASLSKVQTVTDLPTHAIVFHPPYIGLVYASLIDQVLDQPADRIIRKRSHNGGTQPKAT